MLVGAAVRVEALRGALHLELEVAHPVVQGLLPGSARGHDHLLRILELLELHLVGEVRSKGEVAQTLEGAPLCDGDGTVRRLPEEGVLLLPEPSDVLLRRLDAHGIEGNSEGRA